MIGKSVSDANTSSRRGREGEGEDRERETVRGERRESKDDGEGKKGTCEAI